MSQLNHNASYLTEIDGITIWERLRVIRNFLSDRELAFGIAQLGLEKTNELISDPNTNPYKRKKLELHKPQSIELIKDAEDEIKFLKTFEAKLAAKAEESRIPGKSDREMYELNYHQELIEIHLLAAKSEILTTGVISSSTMKAFIRNKEAMRQAVELQLLRPEALKLTDVNPLDDIIKLERP